MSQMKCIECGVYGHIKCSKEADSLKIKISSKVLDDLNEFVNQEFQNAEKDNESQRSSDE